MGFPHQANGRQPGNPFEKYGGSDKKSTATTLTDGSPIDIVNQLQLRIVDDVAAADGSLGRTPVMIAPEHSPWEDVVDEKSCAGFLLFDGTAAGQWVQRDEVETRLQATVCAEKRFRRMPARRSILAKGIHGGARMLSTSRS